jgi:DNA-binding MarR family transcriptional regulator
MSINSKLQKQNLDVDIYLWVLLQRARSVATRVRNLELAQFNLNIEQMSILHSLLIRGGSASVSEIASNVVRQKNSVTTLVDRMSKAGLVRKERLKGEKKFLISLTSKGQDLLNRVPKKSIGMLFANLKSKDKEQFVRYLEMVTATGLELLGENYIPPFLSHTNTTTSEYGLTEDTTMN